MDCFFITCLVIYYSICSSQHACQCFQSNFDMPRTPNLFKLPQTPTERTILPKLTMTRYGRNLNLKKIQLENSTGKVKLELYISQLSGFKDDHVFSLLHQELPQVRYYASLSTCCQNLEKKIGVTGKIWRKRGSNF